MSQQPPGPSGESDDDRTPHDGEPDHGAPEEQPTESLDRSPYDVPEGDTPPQEETAAYPAASYGQAPDPTSTIYSGTTDTEPEPEPGDEDGDGRRRWVLPVVIAAIVLLVAGGIAAALLLGGDDDEPAPAASTTAAVAATTPAGDETTAPTEEPTDAATTPAPTEEPTGPDESLIEDLDTSVTVGDVTFELTGEGFTPDVGIQGATEAVRGVYAAGDERIEMLATTWPDNAAADAFAARLVEGVDGEQVETGSTYTNDTGTFWAFVLSDGRGRYIWTTDRGHVLEVTGSPEYVGGFYSAFPL
ncbi:hypothetical protein FE251_12280 [Georgenia wutianyii]|uniref:Serine/threonine protein kinase n=1 Tax=Georgenia wutianyii TaxID=2585135 RepID=A0ABX5VNN6_9MICO|nr:hypothetical protein [Georgenia wutianyii]QDB80072.1 hypothetical protein FE251_12280 [Georgenia wutianyii]